MWMEISKNRQARSGFTLVEVLVVMMLIALLAVYMVPKYLGSVQEAKRNAAKSQIARLEMDLGKFFMDCGRYPTQAEGLAVLRTAPAGIVQGQWKGPYVKESGLNDPWGHPYVYQYPGSQNPNAFDLISYGSDGQQGGEGEGADIYNN